MSFFFQIFSCWTTAFTPTDLPEEDINNTTITTNNNTNSKTIQTQSKISKQQGSITISNKKQQNHSPKLSSSEIIEEYESTVEWDCWDDEEQEDEEDNNNNKSTNELRDIEIPTIELPKKPIKATIVNTSSNDPFLNQNNNKEDIENEIDFFSDMEPEVKAAKTIILEEKPKISSSRIKMTLSDIDDDDDIEGGWGDNEEDDEILKKTNFETVTSNDMNFEDI